ncbi:hypothetical protein [Terriglobus tenax]|uniref:hypothetical protein n=1 Tax=Terriglobus tenax TaxID=1111115 RepID=UPI0021E0C822|nr:hypothetical protein [Terriglobus tenax]
MRQRLLRRGLLVLSLLYGAAAAQQPAPPPPMNAQEQAGLDALAVAYDPAIFRNLLPTAQLDALKVYDGQPAKAIFKDKQFKAIFKSIVPDCMFHYGKDMDSRDAVQMVMDGSKTPIRLREGRYLLVSGDDGPYLAGRAFVWIDLQEGIGLAGFYFHPTNGEPTPTVTVFSRQVKETSMSMGQLPPEFARDVESWSRSERVPLVTTRYFIGENKKRLLLAHDEEYCTQLDGATAAPGSGCQQMDADSAELDMNAAYYLQQVHYATNATAWMINGPEQVAWLDIRTRTCGVDTACRVRVTREHTAVMIGRPVHAPHPVPHPIGHR